MARVHDTIRRATVNQTPDSSQPATDDQRENIVQSRVLLSTGTVVSDLVCACFDSAADVTLVDLALATRLATANNTLHVVPTAFSATGAVSGASPAATISKITGP